MKWALGILAILAGCSGDPQSPNAEDNLVVGVKLSGLLPSRTVQIIVNDTIPLTVEGPSPKSPLYARSEIVLPVGTYRVRIGGLDPNCVAPAPQMVRVGGYLNGFVSFDIECRDDEVLAGRGLAWISPSDDDWGNSPLSMRMSNGNIIRPLEGYYTTDLAWSDQGDALALMRYDYPTVIFLGPDGSLLPLGGFTSNTSVAIAWVPGQFVLSVLDLSSDGCRVMLIPPASTSFEQSIPCGDIDSTTSQYGGDVAWSPDGLTMAVAVGLEPEIRIVSPQSRTMVKRILPGGMLPAAIEWSSRNGAFFVLGNCAFPCNYGGLTLFEHDAVSGAWKTLASWDSPIAGRHIQTLELLDPGHLAVGPIEGHIHVVSLDAPTQSRVLLPETAFRLSRRP